MMFRGVIQDGKVISDGDVELPDGTRVAIAPVKPPSAARKKKVAEKPRSGGWLSLLQFTVKDDGLPGDFAHQHDHYIYGTPKKPAWKPKLAKPRQRRKA